MVKGLLEIMHNYTKEYKDIEAMPDDLFVPFGNLYNIATEISNRFEQQVSLGDSQPVLLAELEKLMDLLEIPETSKTKMGVKYNRNFLRDYVKKTIVKTKQQALKEIENFCKEEKEDLLKECNIMKDHGILKFNRGAVTALDIIIGEISKQSN
ncbi:MAG: hypothetical protein KDC67_06140 [Ignavibacteriae bacterium]|nr:hypothetical protein [Ignavibacteriota bacterium]